MIYNACVLELDYLGRLLIKIKKMSLTDLY